MIQSLFRLDRALLVQLLGVTGSTFDRLIELTSASRDPRRAGGGILSDRKMGTLPEPDKPGATNGPDIEALLRHGWRDFVLVWIAYSAHLSAAEIELEAAARGAALRQIAIIEAMAAEKERAP